MDWIFFSSPPLSYLPEIPSLQIAFIFAEAVFSGPPDGLSIFLGERKFFPLSDWEASDVLILKTFYAVGWPSFFQFSNVVPPPDFESIISPSPVLTTPPFFEALREHSYPLRPALFSARMNSAWVCVWKRTPMGLLFPICWEEYVSLLSPLPLTLNRDSLEAPFLFFPVIKSIATVFSSSKVFRKVISLSVRHWCWWVLQP